MTSAPLASASLWALAAFLASSSAFACSASLGDDGVDLGAEPLVGVDRHELSLRLLLLGGGLMGPHRAVRESGVLGGVIGPINVRADPEGLARDADGVGQSGLETLVVGVPSARFAGVEAVAADPGDGLGPLPRLGVAEVEVDVHERLDGAVGDLLQTLVADGVPPAEPARSECLREGLDPPHGVDVRLPLEASGPDGLACLLGNVRDAGVEAEVVAHSTPPFNIPLSVSLCLSPSRIRALRSDETKGKKTRTGMW